MRSDGVRFRRRSAQDAFTLTEAAIVLGIIGIILAAIWVAAGIANERLNENDAVNELQQISQNILGIMQNRALPNTSGSYGNTNIITPNMISSGLIPSQYIFPGSSTVATHPWQMGASSLIIYGEAKNVFRVSFYNVPNQGCAALIMQATNCTVGSGCPIDVVTGGGATCYQAPSGTNCSAPVVPSQWSLDPVTAATMCAVNNTSGTGSSVEFDYSTSQ